jgi:hypothetical protein
LSAVPAIDAALHHSQIMLRIFLNDPASLLHTFLAELSTSASAIEHGISVSGDQVIAQLSLACTDRSRCYFGFAHSTLPLSSLPQLPRAAISRLATVLLLIRSVSLSISPSLHDACHACIPALPAFARNFPPIIKSFSFAASAESCLSQGSSAQGLLNAASSFYSHLPLQHMSRCVLIQPSLFFTRNV